MWWFSFSLHSVTFQDLGWRLKGLDLFCGRHLIWNMLWHPMMWMHLFMPLRGGGMHITAPHTVEAPHLNCLHILKLGISSLVRTTLTVSKIKMLRLKESYNALALILPSKRARKIWIFKWWYVWRFGCYALSRGAWIQYLTPKHNNCAFPWDEKVV